MRVSTASSSGAMNSSCCCIDSSMGSVRNAVAMALRCLCSIAWWSQQISSMCGTEERDAMQQAVVSGSDAMPLLVSPLCVVQGAWCDC